ncbi:MAG: hypothetical protein ACE5IH_08820 [Thermodesulfobacteriota bacterium]
MRREEITMADNQEQVDMVIKKMGEVEMSGAQHLALTIIRELREANREEVGRRMTVSAEYAGSLCDSLVEEGYLIRTVQGGYTIREREKEELIAFVRDLKTADEEEIGRKMRISPEHAGLLCEALVKDELLIKAPKGGYVLEEEGRQVLKVVKEFKEADEEEIGRRMGVSSEHAGLLCETLVKEEQLIRTPKGKYILADKDTLGILRAVRELKEANIEEIGRRMGITPECAGLLCDTLVRDGYLRKTTEDGYRLAERYS